MSFQAHYFLGVPIPENTAKAIHGWAEQNKDILRFQNWVVPEDYHITLIFLGAATEKQLQEVSLTIKEEANHFHPFSFEVTSIGSFGLKEQPRVLWAGISHSEELAVLQKRVVSACVPIGFKAEDRPYRPHITMARKWNGKEPLELQSSPFQTTPLKVDVQEVILFRSHRDRTPKYEPVNRFLLGRG